MTVMGQLTLLKPLMSGRRWYMEQLTISPSFNDTVNVFGSDFS